MFIIKPFTEKIKFCMTKEINEFMEEGNNINQETKTSVKKFTNEQN